MAGAGRLTRTGMVFGTPHYMSPEQASGTNVDHRADMYALGIIMYEMFTGKVPFEADSYMGVLTKHMFMDPEPPSHVHEAARELGALEDVTLKCLEKKPEGRYASMQELIDEIETIAQFSGDKLFIVRPSSHLKKPFSRLAPLPGLADQLEMPSRSELRDSLRAAGVPLGPPRAALAAAVIGGAAILAAALYAFAGRSVVSVSTNALAPAPASSLPLAPPASALAPAPASFGPEPHADDVAPPSIDKPPAAVAAAPPKPRRPTPKAAASAPHPAPAPRAPTSAHTGFGSNEIVNPWAR
jgi:serine/threonine-protein kinase